MSKFCFDEIFRHPVMVEGCNLEKMIFFFKYNNNVCINIDNGGVKNGKTLSANFQKIKRRNTKLTKTHITNIFSFIFIKYFI